MEHNYPFSSWFLENSRVIKLIDNAIQQKKSFSLSRFGIGEISYLSWPTHPLLVENFKKYQAYAGITSSPEIVKKDLFTALKTVDMAGLIAPWRLDYWAKTTYEVLYQLKVVPKNICCAWLMHDMVHKGTLWTLLNKKRVILIGRRAKEAVPIFKEKGVDITGFFPLNGYEELDRVVHSIMNEPDWDIALISAGIPATIMAPRIAKESGRVSIDFGHALDIILDGESFNHSMLVEKWNADRGRKG